MSRRTGGTYAALRREWDRYALLEGQDGRWGVQDVEQLPLQIAIAFFAVQVAAWAGVCTWLRLSHMRRKALLTLVSETAEPEVVAQAA